MVETTPNKTAVDKILKETLAGQLRSTVKLSRTSLK